MSQPREGMMAVVRNRRAMITGVQPSTAEDGQRWHLVEVEYSDGLGAETDRLLWEIEPDTQVLEPSALPSVDRTPPMDPAEFDAMVRAARWSALTPSLPFSGLAEDKPAVASPLFGAIHPEPYQLVPVLRALEMPRVALMLADAVGLGKTIQAGMILRELMLRRRVRRVLILCPASLRTQWRDELDEKFSLPFEVVDRPQTLKLQREIGLDANPWRTHERIVASYHYVKQADVLEQLRSAAEPGEDGRLRWDLLIVDEAHNLSPASFGRDSDLSRMLQTIAPWFEHRVFLTATPHNGHTRSFSGLLEALDPVRFTRKSELDEQDRHRVGESVIRRLKSEINQAYTRRGEAPRFAERLVEALPSLRFGRQERAVQEAFHDFRKALRKATRGAEGAERMAAGFALEVLQKRMLSGPWAFGQSWLALVDGLEERAGAVELVARARAAQSEDTDDDSERESRQRLAERTVGAWLHGLRDLVADEMLAVTTAVQQLGVERVPRGLDPGQLSTALAKAAPKVVSDARLRTLEALIDERLRDGQGWRDDERLVVFTEYLATLHYLRERLIERYGDGPWLVSLYGGMTDAERDHVKRVFNDARGPTRILLATDAAGEGLNLQRSCRLLLHWDIPWNPGKMEQRNGRLDRHGQERDVSIFHFDSADDASMRFLGKVLEKRSQTREDRVVTDELFASAILAHFDQDEDPVRVADALSRRVGELKARKAASADDLAAGAVLPGGDDDRRLRELRRKLDISPASLRDTLETAMAIDAGRPRLKPDAPGRDRFVHPIPRLWDELISDTLRTLDERRALPAVAFDPAVFVEQRNGRPVYLPDPSARLLHLGHALYHRVMSTFARYRFPGGPSAATRWTARTQVGPWPVAVPNGAEAVILLTVEELAVNQLREPCHHWVETLALPVVGGALGEPLDAQPADVWSAGVGSAAAARAVEVWEEVDRDVKRFVEALEKRRTEDVTSRLAQSGERVKLEERERFKKRRAELTRALSENTLDRLAAENAKLRAALEQERVQLDLLGDSREDELRRALADNEAERALRQGHYETVIDALDRERARVIDQILPYRYKLRGGARVYPIAVEIRLAGGAR